jgi:hypothetical protein
MQFNFSQAGWAFKLILSQQKYFFEKVIFLEYI